MVPASALRQERHPMVSVATQVRPLSERRFFTWMSVAMAAVAFAGFARTYYLAGFHDAPTPVLTPVVHLHGALCTAWILLLIAQTQLIGSAGVLLGSALVVTGVYVALHSQRRVHTPATADTLADPYVFLVFPTF